MYYISNIRPHDAHNEVLRNVRCFEYHPCP